MYQREGGAAPCRALMRGDQQLDKAQIRLGQIRAIDLNLVGSCEATEDVGMHRLDIPDGYGIWKSDAGSILPLRTVFHHFQQSMSTNLEDSNVIIKE